MAPRVFSHLGAQVAIVAGCSDVCRVFEKLVPEEANMVSSSSESSSIVGNVARYPKWTVSLPANRFDRGLPLDPVAAASDRPGDDLAAAGGFKKRKLPPRSREKQ
jgi:hypothetical protein